MNEIIRTDLEKIETRCDICGSKRYIAIFSSYQRGWPICYNCIGSLQDQIKTGGGDFYNGI